MAYIEYIWNILYREISHSYIILRDISYRRTFYRYTILRDISVKAWQKEYLRDILYQLER